MGNIRSNRADPDARGVISISTSLRCSISEQRDTHLTPVPISTAVPALAPPLPHTPPPRHLNRPLNGSVPSPPPEVGCRPPPPTAMAMAHGAQLDWAAAGGGAEAPPPPPPGARQRFRSAARRARAVPVPAARVVGFTLEHGVGCRCAREAGVVAPGARPGWGTPNCSSRSQSCWRLPSSYILFTSH